MSTADFVDQWLSNKTPLEIRSLKMNNSLKTAAGSVIGSVKREDTEKNLLFLIPLTPLMFQIMTLAIQENIKMIVPLNR